MSIYSRTANAEWEPRVNAIAVQQYGIYRRDVWPQTRDARISRVFPFPFYAFCATFYFSFKSSKAKPVYIFYSYHFSIDAFICANKNGIILRNSHNILFNWKFLNIFSDHCLMLRFLKTLVRLISHCRLISVILK